MSRKILRIFGLFHFFELGLHFRVIQAYRLKWATLYKDEILNVWTDTSWKMDQFLAETNVMNENIKFIAEKEDNTINYLVLTHKLERNKI